MNRINSLFNTKKTEILSVYFTAGFPKIDSTKEILLELESAGADLVEIGIPFSDPIADGPTIQQSNQVALDNGMTLQVLFSQLEDIRKEVGLPIILMGYLNPILQFGIEKFCAKCQELGIDGLIVPDLPLEIYQENYRAIFEKYQLKFIFLITPQTSHERIQMIDRLSDSFIYMVSSASTTGAKSGINADQEVYFERVKFMKLKNPCLVGFGIADHASFSKVNRYAQGAIVGSAFIKMLEKESNIKQGIFDFVMQIKNKSTLVSK